MKPGKADRVRTIAFFLFVFLLAAVPAYCQRGTLDLNVGQTSDRFGSLAPVTSAVIDINGEVTVIPASAKNWTSERGGRRRGPSSCRHVESLQGICRVRWRRLGLSRISPSA